MTDLGRSPSTMQPRPDDDPLLTQVRGILNEVLEAGRLPEHAKDRLRVLMVEHAEHPERALIEHLRAVRCEAGRELLAR